jgi:hypothetical protein
MIRIVLHIALFGILLVSCRKDKVQPIEENEACDCTPIPLISGPTIGYNYVSDSIFFLSPQFNPNSDNEIIFTQNSNAGQKTIYKYDLLTEQKIPIYEGAMNYAPNWGKQDWILFDKGDYQIWKMKSNGDSVTLVTTNGAYFHPEWNYDGTKFIAYHGFVDVSDYHVGTVWSSDGVILDTFSYPTLAGDWKHQEYYAGVSSHLLSIINPHTKETISTFNSTDAVAFNGFDWISDNYGVYTTNEGIFSLNTLTGKREKLYCSCNSVQYSQGSTNSDGSKILYRETVSTPIDANTLKVRNNLVIFDTDSWEFTRLDISI